MKKTKILNQKFNNFLLGLLPFVIIFIAWQIAYSFSFIPNWILPSPLDTLYSLGYIFKSGAVFSILYVSFVNIMPAFIVAVICSVVVGFGVGMNQILRKMTMPFLSAVYIVPTIAWLPLIILFFDFSRETIWILVFISTFTRVVYSIINGVRSVDVLLILVGKNLGLNKWEIAWNIVFPASLPHILSGIRVGFGSAWRSLIGAEMLVVTAGGLGKYIWMSQWQYKVDQVLAGIFLIAIIGVFFEVFILGYIERRTLQKWGMLN